MSFGERIIIHHDPFTEGEDFEEQPRFWLIGSLKEWVLVTVKDSQQKEKLLNAYKIGGLSTNQVKDTWLRMNLDLVK